MPLSYLWKVYKNSNIYILDLTDWDRTLVWLFSLYPILNYFCKPPQSLLIIKEKFKNWYFVNPIGTIVVFLGCLKYLLYSYLTFFQCPINEVKISPDNIWTNLKLCMHDFLLVVIIIIIMAAILIIYSEVRPRGPILTDTQPPRCLICSVTAAICNSVTVHGWNKPS